MTMKIFEGQLKFDAKQPEFTDNGYLKCDAIIAKVGIVTRTDSKTGEIRNEFVSEQSLFSKKSLESLFALPVTQYHPQINNERVLLTPENTALFQKGITIGTPEKLLSDGEIYLKVPVVISDKKVINDVLNGTTPTISCGYLTTDKKISGKYKNMDYNYIQGERKNNHIALDRQNFNRSGNDVRIKFDSLAENEFFYTEGYDNNIEKKEIKKVALVSLKCDSKTVEVEELAQVHIENKFKTDAKKISDLESEKLALQTKFDSLQASFDEKTEKLKELNGFKEKFQKQELEKLQNTAKTILGNDFKFDALTNIEIQKEVLKKARPNLDLTGLTETYITARFDAIVEDAKFDAVNVQAYQTQQNISNMMYSNANQKTAQKNETDSFFDSLSKDR